MLKGTPRVSETVSTRTATIKATEEFSDLKRRKWKHDFSNDALPDVPFISYYGVLYISIRLVIYSSITQLLAEIYSYMFSSYT